MNGRTIVATNSISHQALGLSTGFASNNHNNNLTSINSQHGSKNTGNGISANNYNNSNHHQNHHHHLGHSLHRNRHLSATAAATSLNSQFTHSHFNSSSNLSQNSHHHHHLSLSSDSSAVSLASSSSSSPSASISPSSITLGSSPHSSLSAVGFHQGAGGSPFHNSASHVIENSHHSSTQQQQPPQQQNTSRYKTELCRPFEENGTCKYGEKCQFAHGLSELRTLTRHPKYKTEFCRTFHTTGFCPYGPRCHFIHNSKTPPTQAQLGIGSYSKLPFGHQTSHSASPSTSPISSTSSATTTNGSLSSSESTSSSSPPSSSRLLDVPSSDYAYRTIDVSSNGINSSVSEGHPINKNNVIHSLRRNENEDVSQSSGCVSDTQRLFWVHSHMNEGSRWPLAMCASGLIGSSNARRTWQMQA